MKRVIRKMVNAPLAVLGLELIRRGSGRYPQIPVEANSLERQLLEECGKFSMTGSTRMWALMQSINYVADEILDGDLVECGVWKGGSLAVMRLLANHRQLKKKVIGFDTFDGMVEAKSVDVDLFGNSARKMMKESRKDEGVTNIHAYASIEQVEKNLCSLGAREGVILVKGNVEDTLMVPENIPEKISILRLDTDWYESTRLELEVLYPKLVHGGVLIIDDYGHFRGAQKAVDEYFRGENIWPHYVDYTCRLIIKK